MPQEPKVLRKMLRAIDPWTASGPGWSNQGVTGYFEVVFDDGTVKTTSETVYRHDLNAAEHAVFSIAVDAIGTLKRRFEQMQQS